ncbi:MFS transporter [Alcaligenaceae bacterium A4P071]|nr:MFS transporter [Alcaligenaceae bacterium A4P071]
MTREPSGWIVLVATTMVQSLVAMALLTLPVIAPVVALAMGVSPAYVGLYVAIVYAGAMVASLVAGGAVRRYGAIRLSQIGLVLCAIGLLLCTLPYVPTMVLGAALIGFGYGPITPASSHLLIRNTPAHRMSLVFSIKQTGVPLGGMLAGAIVPGLQVLIGWQWAFAAVAVASLVCAAAVQPLCGSLDSDRDPAHPVSFGRGFWGPIRLVLSRRSLAVLAACSFLLSIIQLSLTTYVATFLHEDLLINLVTAGFILAVSQLAGVTGRLVWGYISDRYLGAPRMLAVLAALVALSGLATAFMVPGTSTVLLLVVLSVFGASAIGWNGVYLAEVARQAPAGQTSVATGGALAFTFLGVVVGPPIFGAIASAAGSYGLAYASLIVPAALCFALTLGFRKAFVPAASAPTASAGE